jgi:imidazolonepropionase-like amidohydrolase
LATAPGDRWFTGMYREADGADEVRRGVREQLRRGADFVKVMTTGARSVELEDRFRRR